MSRCIWYVSKYVITPNEGEPASRGFGLMREFARLGHRAVIVTSDSMGKFGAPVADRPFVVTDEGGVTVCRARTIKYLESNSLRRILSWLHFEWKLVRMPRRLLPRPDVIVVSSLSLLTVLNGLRLRRRYRCPLVFEVRDIWPLTIVEEGGFSSRNPLVLALGVIERIGYRRADLIVGTMPNLREHVQNVLGEARRVECIPMGVDLEMVAESKPLPDEYVATYIPEGKFIVGYAGSLGVSNAMNVLFECAESISPDGSVHFLVVGDGELRGRLVEQFGDLPNVTIAPPVPKAQVQDLLSYCDVLFLSVAASRVWDYGLSLNKLIDYMMAGKPIVASYSGFPSMIDEADCGVFTPAGDAGALRLTFTTLSQLSESERRQMGERGRDYLIRNRSFETLARLYLDYLPS